MKVVAQEDRAAARRSAAASCVVVTKGGTVAAVTLKTTRLSLPASALAGLADRHREDAVDDLGRELVLGAAGGRGRSRSCACAPISAATASMLSPLSSRSASARALSARRRATCVLAPLRRRPRRGPRRASCRAPARCRRPRTRHSRRPASAAPRCRRRCRSRRRRGAARRARAGSATGSAGLVLAAAVDRRRPGRAAAPSPCAISAQRPGTRRAGPRSRRGRRRCRSRRARRRARASPRPRPPRTASTLSGSTFVTRTRTVPNRPCDRLAHRALRKREGGLGDGRVDHFATSRRCRARGPSGRCSSRRDRLEGGALLEPAGGGLRLLRRREGRSAGSCVARACRSGSP